MTQFGGNWQGLNSVDESFACTDLIGCTWVRDAITLSVYDGVSVDSGLQTKRDAGLKIALNINWEGGSGLKNFCTDLITYSTQLSLFLINNKQNFDIAIIENEPDNRRYWNYLSASGAIAPYTTVADYLALLDVAINECHAQGVLVADGCVHLKGLLNNKQGPPLSIPAQITSDLLDGYADLDLDYVNFHFQVPDSGISNSNSTLVPHIIKDLVEYYTLRTGHPVITNEWHQETGGTYAEIQQMCFNIVQQIAQANIPVAVTFGGDGSSGAIVMVNPSLTLTYLGEAYRDAIHSTIAVPSITQNDIIMTSGYPLRYDFRPMKSGDGFLGVKFNFFDANDEPVDFSGATALMQLRRTAGNKVIKEWKTDDSTIEITINEVYIKYMLMDIPEYKYLYDLEITYPDDVPFTAAEGIFQISNDISRRQ